jgi:hypothetical protein
MSKFDDTVNSILYRQILEQAAPITVDNSSDPDVIKAKEEIEKYKKEFQNVLTNNYEEWREQATQKQNEIDNIATAFINTINEIDSEENVKKVLEEKFHRSLKNKLIKEATFDEIWGSSVDTAKKYGKDFLDMFKKGQETFTKALVDQGGSLLDRYVGSDVVNDVNKMSDHWLYRLIAIVDFTGVMSWPYLNEAVDLYEKNKNGEDENIYALNLLAAAIAVTPGVTGLPILGWPFKILTWGMRMPGAVLRFFGGNQAKIVARSMSNRIITALGKNPNSAKIAKILDSGVGGSRIGSALKSIFKGAAKWGTAGAKVATAASGGNIPKMVDDLINKGKGLIDQKFTSSPLGQFSSFPEYRTN